MIYILLFFAAGALIGHFLKRSQKVMKANQRLQNMTVFALLFFMGISTGSNDTILRNLPSLGKDALINCCHPGYIGQHIGSVPCLSPVFQGERMSGLLLVLPFIAGLAAGALEWISAVGFPEQTQTLLIYALLFFIGVSVGSDEETLANLKTLNLLSLLVPFSILAGSLIGGAVGSVLINRIDVNEGMSIGAGLGYYSLSSVLIGQLRGEELGVIALMANIFREVSTILFAPLLVSLFGEMALIASGGATTSDTSLPVIQRYSGNRYTLIAVFNGIVLSLLVPLVVPLFL